MGLRQYLSRGAKKGSAAVASERLRIIVAQERAQRNSPDYLPMLHRELLEVIRKYVNVDQEAVTVRVENMDDQDVLELNVVLPHHER